MRTILRMHRINCFSWSKYVEAKTRGLGIFCALSSKAGGYSGLMGVFITLQASGQWVGTIPWRLYDNYKSGYAALYTWGQL